MRGTVTPDLTSGESRQLGLLDLSDALGIL